MSKSVQRKPSFFLYPDTNKEGAIKIEGTIAELLDVIEEAHNNNHIDDYERGMYNVLIDVMACPTAMLKEKYMSILEHINMNVQENLSDEIEDEPMVMSLLKDDLSVVKVGNANLPVVVPDAIPEPDLTDDDMEKELAELEKNSQAADDIAETYGCGRY